MCTVNGQCGNKNALVQKLALMSSVDVISCSSGFVPKPNELSMWVLYFRTVFVNQQASGVFQGPTR